MFPGDYNIWNFYIFSMNFKYNTFRIKKNINRRLDILFSDLGLQGKDGQQLPP